MGGRPLLCMNILACPVGSMPDTVFQDVVRGGLSKIEEAGALLVGGHSIEDAELKYGLSVTGIVHPDRILLNAGAVEGDVLVLTKPLGTGIISTAIKGGLAGEKEEKQISRIMATLNRLPAAIVQEDPFFQAPENKVHACTDITGFGLIGHLHEMAQASQAAIRVGADRLPLIEGVLDFADMGIIPVGAHTNYSYYSQWLHSEIDAESSLELIACDPQTSGGLLFSLPKVGACYLLERLQEESYPFSCVIIGNVIAGSSGTVALVKSL